jgi:hypothetical protein
MAQDDELLAEQGVLGHQFWLAAQQVAEQAGRLARRSRPCRGEGAGRPE